MSDRLLESISPMMMTSLSESALLEAMDQVPLDDLYKTERECARWRSLKPTALARRRSVTLVVSSYWPLDYLVEQSCFNIPHLAELDMSTGTYPITPELDYRTVHHSIIRLDNLTQDEAARLATSFPLVRDLRVVISQADREEIAMPRVTFLLTQWKATLVSLKLSYQGNLPPEQDVTLLSALNALVELKHLTLETPLLQLAPHADYYKSLLEPRPDQPQERIDFPQIGLQVLSGLKELNLATLDHPNCLAESLKSYANGCVIRLAMARHYSQHQQLLPGHDYETVPQVVVCQIGSITASNTYDLIDVDDKFGGVCGRFNGLISLSIRVKHDMSMMEIMDQMAPLAKSLIYLHVTFSTKEDIFQGAGQVQMCEDPLIPLPSVKILSLSCETLTNHHTDLTPLRIGEAFPNLVVIQVVDTWLYGFACEHHCQSLFKPELVKCCVQRQLQSLSQCTTLKTVFYGYNSINVTCYQGFELFPEPTAQDGPNTVGMNMSNLPFEMVLEVFARLHLAVLFIVNQVCSRWHQLRDHELHRRTDVTLLVYPYQLSREQQVLGSRFSHNLDKIRHNSLRCFWLSQADTSRLVSTFPSISTLRLFQRSDEHDFDQMELVRSLLDQLSHSLTKLTISYDNGQSDLDDFEYPIGLLETINRMHKLKHLSMEFPGRKLDPVRVDTRFDLEVLGRLTRFRFWSRDHPRMMMHSLQAYAETNTNLTQVHLLVYPGEQEDWFQGQQFRSLSRALRGKIQFGRVI